MRIAFVVQRYGEQVAGGAEALARMFAERLAARGHDVSALTSCAADYRTWQDEYPPGTAVEKSVSVTRVHVPRPRDDHRFAPISARALAPGRRPSGVLDAAWMQEQGPIFDEMARAVAEVADRCDVVSFLTYLYAPTVIGLPAAATRCATILHPTAHDEAPLRLPSIRRAFDLTTGIGYSTPEEAELVDLRFRPGAPASVLGIGFDPPPGDLDPSRFRRRFGLGDEPYLLFLGRIDPNKAADEAIGHVLRHRRELGSDVKLVLMGMAAMDLPDDPGVIVTGFVDEVTRWDAIAGALALYQPSYQESFSMAVAEAWQVGRPAIVQGHCDVLAGLVERGGGGLPYRGYREFCGALDLLLERPGLGEELGAAGRRYVADDLGWDPVLDRYEALADASRAEFSRRRTST